MGHVPSFFVCLPGRESQAPTNLGPISGAGAVSSVQRGGLARWADPLGGTCGGPVAWVAWVARVAWVGPGDNAKSDETSKKMWKTHQNP